MENLLNIVNQLRHWNKGNFNTSDLDKLALAGWVSFACKPSALVRKTDILFRRLEQIAFSPKFNLSESTAVLKNVFKGGKTMDVIEIRKASNKHKLLTIFYKDPETGLAGVIDPKGNSLASGSWEDIKTFLMGGDLDLPEVKDIKLPEEVLKPKPKKAPVKATVVKKSNKAKAAELDSEPTDDQIAEANKDLVDIAE